MTQGGTTTVVGFGGFGLVTQLVMADHEMLIELLAYRVLLEPKLETVDSSFPFTVPLILLTHFRYEPKKLAPQTLARKCAPWMATVSGQKITSVHLQGPFEPRHYFRFQISGSRFVCFIFFVLTPHSMVRTLHCRFKRPYIHPALSNIQADLTVLKKNDIITPDQLS
jgi:hypothetical protein